MSKLNCKKNQLRHIFHVIEFVNSNYIKILRIFERKIVNFLLNDIVSRDCDMFMLLD